MPGAAIGLARRWGRPSRRRSKLPWMRPDSGRESGRRSRRRARRRTGRAVAPAAPWVPVRLGEDPVAHALIQAAGDGGAQQRARIAIAQTLDDQFRQAAQLTLVTGIADGEDQPDRVGQRQPRRALLGGLGQHPPHHQHSLRPARTPRTSPSNTGHSVRRPRNNEDRGRATPLRQPGHPPGPATWKASYGLRDGPRPTSAKASCGPPGAEIWEVWRSIASLVLVLCVLTACVVTGCDALRSQSAEEGPSPGPVPGVIGSSVPTGAKEKQERPRDGRSRGLSASGPSCSRWEGGPPREARRSGPRAMWGRHRGLNTPRADRVRHRPRGASFMSSTRGSRGRGRSHTVYRVEHVVVQGRPIYRSVSTCPLDHPAGVRTGEPLTT